MQKIGIIGIGILGETLKRYFETKHELYFYDIKGLGSMEEVNKADYIYICVPTPHNLETGCDTSIVEEAISKIEGSKVIIIKSTVIPGTTDRLQEKYPQHKILFNPEFLTTKNAMQDFLNPDSQIIGYTKESKDVCNDVLNQLPIADYAIIPAKTAEMIKYARNSFLAMKVAKNNELYDLCKKAGFSENEWEMVVNGLGNDRRIGKSHLEIFHNGGRGYSGKCLPKDTKALLKFAEKLGVDMPISKAMDEYNDSLGKKE